MALKKSMPEKLWQERFEEELKEVDVDPRFHYMLDSFYDLSRARDYTQTGHPMSLKWQDIKAYSDLVRSFNQWEVETLIEMDHVFIQTAGEVTKE